jgi:hypothetical protein
VGHSKLDCHSPTALLAAISALVRNRHRPTAQRQKFSHQKNSTQGFRFLILHSVALSLPDMGLLAMQTGNDRCPQVFGLPSRCLLAPGDALSPHRSIGELFSAFTAKLRWLKLPSCRQCNSPFTVSGLPTSGRGSQGSALPALVIPPRHGGERWKLICSAREGCYMYEAIRRDSFQTDLLSLLTAQADEHSGPCLPISPKIKRAERRQPTSPAFILF